MADLLVDRTTFQQGKSLEVGDPAGAARLDAIASACCAARVDDDNEAADERLLGWGAAADEWSAPWAAVTGAGGLGLLLAVLTLTISDPPGRLLLAIGAGLAVVAAAAGALLRPTLTADTEGLVLRRGLRVDRVGWASVRRVRERTERHRGLASSHLEIELAAGEDGDDPVLVVYPRLLLGAEPADIANRLAALRAGERH